MIKFFDKIEYNISLIFFLNMFESTFDNKLEVDYDVNNIFFKLLEIYKQKLNGVLSKK